MGMMIRARLHPIWVGGRDGYRYSVVLDGQLLVERSRDPECDAARALLPKASPASSPCLMGRQAGLAPSSISRKLQGSQ